MALAFPKAVSRAAYTENAPLASMITAAHYTNLQGLKQRPCEDRSRILDGAVPIVRSSDCGQLFAVADGVGSAPKALHAAQHAVDKLHDFYLVSGIQATVQGLNRLLFDANMEIYSWGMIPGTDRPLGATTMTVAWLTPARELVLLQTGDTVAYRYDGRLTRLTREHSDGRAITSYIGTGPRCRIDVHAAQIQEGDLLCLVTDGVTKSMPDEAIGASCGRSVRSEPHRSSASVHEIAGRRTTSQRSWSSWRSGDSDPLREIEDFPGQRRCHRAFSPTCISTPPCVPTRQTTAALAQSGRTAPC